MPFAEDQSVYFADYGEDVLIIPVVGEARTITAIFDDPAAEPSVGEHTVDTTGPYLTVRDSDLLGVGRGAGVECRGARYSVLEVRPDGTGMSLVDLAHEEDMEEEP